MARDKIVQTDTEIQLILPPLSHGTHKVMIFIDGIGMAALA